MHLACFKESLSWRFIDASGARRPNYQVPGYIYTRRTRPPQVCCALRRGGRTIGSIAEPASLAVTAYSRAHVVVGPFPLPVIISGEHTLFQIAPQKVIAHLPLFT
jgi:hypothetical protein